MKKNICLLSFVILAVSCSNKSEKIVDEQTPLEVPEVKVAFKQGNESLPGFAKINQSDCLSCHKDNGKFIGPSYAEISDKYSDADKEVLATRIIEGSKGIWGEVPMAAHPNLSKEDAIEMVEYILSLQEK